MEVVFNDTSKEVIDALKKLSKTGMRKAGKTVGKKIKENTKVRTAKLQSSVGYWAKIDRQTGQPELQIGYFSKANMKRKGKKVPFANPNWIEFGTKPHIITAGIRSSRGKVLYQTGKKILTDGTTSYGKSAYNKGMQGKNTLRNTVYDNISEIKSIQEETLKLLNQEVGDIIGQIEESEDDEFV